MRPWAPLLLVARGALVGGDFVFVDFNETQGLRLNGDAETSACAAEAGRAHGPDERGAAPGALPAVQATTSETKRVETADTLRGGADDAPRARASSTATPTRTRPRVARGARAGCG